MERWNRALNAESSVESGQSDAPAHDYLASLLEAGRLAEADSGNLQRRHSLGTLPLRSGHAREARDLGAQLVGDAQPL